jgi:sulfite reductase (NADPH) flavoprotein alpha-component
MFAAGTGLAPFRGFLEARRDRQGRTPDWLFFATRTRATRFHPQFLEQLVAEGRLHARVAFSRDDVGARFDPGAGCFVFEPDERHRIGVEIERRDNARVLWNMLQEPEDGGEGAYFYVCGQTGFASSVMRALKGVVRRFCGERGDAAELCAQRTMQRVVAEGRYSQEIFTTYVGAQI